LKGKSIFPADSSLRNHVNSADKEMHPRLVFAPLIAPRDAATSGV